MKEDAPATKREMRWGIVLWYIHLHALGLYGLWLFLFEAKWLTVIFATLITAIATFGITAGAHRLWAHQSYTASWHLKLFLMLAHTLAAVGNIYDWVVAHRIHHRYYGTEADPYNNKKGFVYSHILGNLLSPHPSQEKGEKDIDTRDIQKDLFVWIQRRLYWVLMPVVGLLLPINAPAEYWGETIFNSVFVLGFMRLAITANVAWLVNSANIVWGLKPGDKLISFFITIYDTLALIYRLFFKMPKSHGTVVIDHQGVRATPMFNLSPSTLPGTGTHLYAGNGERIHETVLQKINVHPQRIFSVFCIYFSKMRFAVRYPPDDNVIFVLRRSFWPQYHYMLPWDYKSGEFGTYDQGCTTKIIQICEIIGLASGLKTASSEAIREALGKVVTTGSKLNDCLKDVYKSAEEEVVRKQLAFKH